MTKNQIINKVIENYNNIHVGSSKRTSGLKNFINKVINNICNRSSKGTNELNNFINEFPDIENLFDENKFDKFCKNEVERPRHNWIYRPFYRPLDLFCGYMFKTHMNTTINNWPDSRENLVDSLHYWNYSADILY